MAENKHNILISERLYLDIKRYCAFNGLKVNTFVESLLLKAFNVEKYGETPFQKQEPEPEPVVAPVRIVDEYAAMLEVTDSKPAILPPEINEKIASGETLETIEVKPMAPPTIPVPEKPKRKVTRLK